MSYLSGKSSDRGYIVTVLFLVAVVFMSVIFLKPVVMAGKEGKERYLIRNAGIAIDSALRKYCEMNDGKYPADNEIIGNHERDELIKRNIIISYPENHHMNNGSTMRNVTSNDPATGDFSYRRNPEKVYEFELVVYGPGKEKIFISRFGD